MPSNNCSFNYWGFTSPSRAAGRGVDHSPSFSYLFGGPRPREHGVPHSHHRHHHGHYSHYGPAPRMFGTPNTPWWFFEDESINSEPYHRRSHGNRRRGHRHHLNAHQDHSISDNSETLCKEKEKSCETLKEGGNNPAAVTTNEEFTLPHRGLAMFDGRRGFGRRGREWHGRGPRDQDSGPEDRNGGFEVTGFNSSGNMRGFTSHPFFHDVGEAPNHCRSATQSTDPKCFSPPVDMFNTPGAYVLHIALPGVKKDDISVSWSPETSILRISGVVHRPGNEEFLSTLHAGERRVGVFEREIAIPPAGTKGRDEIDGEGLAAKIEDGVLIVSVPKTEKDWTEIRQVDIA